MSEVKNQSPTEYWGWSFHAIPPFISLGECPDFAHADALVESKFKGVNLILSRTEMTEMAISISDAMLSREPQFLAANFFYLDDDASWKMFPIAAATSLEEAKSCRDAIGYYTASRVDFCQLIHSIHAEIERDMPELISPDEAIGDFDSP